MTEGGINEMLDSSLLQLLPFYERQDGVHTCELQIDKRTLVGLFGWPLQIYNLDKTIKCESSDTKAVFRFKGYNRNEILVVMFDKDGGILKLYDMRPTDQCPTGVRLDFAPFSWREIRAYVDWLNRFSRDRAEATVN